MIYVNYEHNSWQELLEKGYSGYDKFTETYADSECEVIQCRSARRSFADLFEIVNTYYKVSKEELCKFLFDKENEFNIRYCPDIDCIVFTKGVYINSFNLSDFLIFLYDYGILDEDSKLEDYSDKSGYTIIDLLKFANKEELIKTIRLYDDYEEDDEEDYD